MRRLWWMASYGEEAVSGAALTIMTAITVANVIARYVFNASFTWGEELVGAFAVWCVFVGAAACYRRGMHIGIDFFVDLLPPVPKRVVAVFISLLLIIACAYLSYLSLVFAVGAWGKRTQVLEIRYFYIDAGACVGFGMMTIHSVVQCVAAVRRRGGPARGDGERALLEI
jgi:TRAP-type C4-dicarboxylate transport system permease small subunit